MAKRKRTKTVSEKDYKIAVAMGDLAMSSPYISKQKKKKVVLDIWDNL